VSSGFFDLHESLNYTFIAARMEKRRGKKRGGGERSPTWGEEK